MNAVRLIIISVLFSFLIGCASQQRPLGNADYRSNQQKAALQASNFIAMSQQAKGTAAAIYRLRAAEQLILAENIEGAETLYNQEAKTKFDSNDNAYKHIIGAQLYLAKRDVNAARQSLGNIWTPRQLPENLQVKFLSIRAEIYRRSGNLIEAAQEHVYLSRFLKAETERKENNKIIWSLLSELTPDTLKSLQNPESADEFNGWVYFANISKQYDVSVHNKARALALWKNKFPNHPANSFITEEMRNLKEKPEETTNITTTIAATADQRRQQDIIRKAAAKSPKKIAMLLPLHGQYAPSAQAIRDGFMTAFYAHNSSTGKPKIQIYDTSKGNLKAAYQQAVNDGANFIVGPLIKEEVENLIENTDSSVPILALNNVNKDTSNSNLFQFGLSPEMEAVAVAEKAWRDGHRTALIISSKSAWGKRMQATFEESWLAMGGKILATMQVASHKELNAQIQKLLAIDASEERANNLKALGLKFNFEPRRRQDPNMIFIATNANLARQLKPLLNFYYAANLPAYASSSIYNGKPAANLDQDLNGVQFCDMPWVLDNSMNTKASYKLVTETWPREFEQYPRLFALGIDAYKIAIQFEQLKMLPELGISGMTGMLTLGQENKFQRKLMWASFKRGVPYLSGEQM